MDAYALMLHQTLMLTAVISIPVLLIATLIGTSLALLQAVTQVQEQTLIVLPKFFFVGAFIALGGHFAMSQLGNLLRHGVALMPTIVRAQ